MSLFLVTATHTSQSTSRWLKSFPPLFLSIFICLSLSTNSFAETEKPIDQKPSKQELSDNTEATDGAEVSQAETEETLEEE